MAEELVGKVTHWFGNINVAGIGLTGRLAAGDRIHVLGHTTDFETDVTSMQIDRKEVPEAGAGDDIGVKLDSRARAGDSVYKVT
ncbi:MAG: translation elongation factor-like protein [Anaerolineales bacterium]|nr:MAG: translation elongation factor-like protein [Anaerolineales bacterium]